MQNSTLSKVMSKRLGERGRKQDKIKEEERKNKKKDRDGIRERENEKEIQRTV